MAIPMDRTFGFLERTEPTGRQGQQMVLFHFFKDFAYLPTRGAVNTRVGNTGFRKLSSQMRQFHL
jgi:hypothetical protein